MKELFQLFVGHQELGVGISGGVVDASGFQIGTRGDVGLGFVAGTCAQGSVDGWCIRCGTDSALKGLDPNIPGML